MTPGSTSYENILEVENQGSQLSRFFKILAPVQITLESCTGLGEIDQYSIQMLSLIHICYAISSVLGIPMIYFAMQKNISMFLLFMFIKGIFAGTLSGSLNALIAEASGYTTRTTGVHMDGMMYSCSSLGVKVGGGIGTAAVGWLLKLGGFVAVSYTHLHFQLVFPPALPLHPVIPDNACDLRFTAAAGT